MLSEFMEGRESELVCQLGVRASCADDAGRGLDISVIDVSTSIRLQCLPECTSEVLHQST